MGADLIGFHAILPSELSDKEVLRLKEYHQKMMTLLKEYQTDWFQNDKYLPEFDVWAGKLSQLSRYNVLDRIQESISYDGEEAVKDTIEEAIDWAESFFNSEAMFNTRAIIKNFWGLRDSNNREITILGRTYERIFSGDMSWGDSPTGDGYETLKQLEDLGYLDFIENMTLRKEPISNAGMFIENISLSRKNIIDTLENEYLNTERASKTQQVVIGVDLIQEIIKSLKE